MALQLLLIVSMILLVVSDFPKHPSIQSIKAQAEQIADTRSEKDLHTQESGYYKSHHKIKYPGKLKAKSSKWWDGYVKGWYDGWNQGFNWHKKDDHHEHGGGHHVEHHGGGGGHYDHLIGHHSHGIGGIGYGGDAYGHSAHASEQVLYTNAKRRPHVEDIQGHHMHDSGEHGPSLHGSEAHRHFMFENEGHGLGIGRSGGSHGHNLLRSEHISHREQPVAIPHGSISLARITHEPHSLRSTSH